MRNVYLIIWLALICVVALIQSGNRSIKENLSDQAFFSTGAYLEEKHQLIPGSVEYPARLINQGASTSVRIAGTKMPTVLSMSYPPLHFSVHVTSCQVIFDYAFTLLLLFPNHNFW